MDRQSIWEKLHLGKWKKEDYLVLALAGILLIVVAMPVRSSPDSEKRETTTASQGTVDGEKAQLLPDNFYGEYWEQRLEKTLSQMDGVGACKVMLTLEDHGERIVEKDAPLQTSNTEEKDKDGGERRIREYSGSEETVFYTDEEGRQLPYVVKEETPRVTGVVVIAQGADNARVKEQITRLLEALFDVEVHKVIVVKMKTG